MTRLLNLGCGYRYHKDWVNVDFVSTGEGVVAHNLLHGIPFPENYFDAVYHSHVLEHFPKEEAPAFVRECFRVLKPGGIIRIAVPDLETIVREYLKHLEGALTGDPMATHNYDWIMVELYDQTVRNISGGAYGTYWSQEVIPNEQYIIQRMGYEYHNARKIIDAHKKAIAAQKSAAASPVSEVEPVTGQAASQTARPAVSASRFLNPLTYLNKAKKLVFKREYAKLHHLKQKVKHLEEQLAQKNAEEAYTRLGKFRMSGEIHQWMYDRYSLGRLLEDAGFMNFAPVTALQSRIVNWPAYELDTEQGEVRKPDSLFAEATKPK